MNERTIERYLTLLGKELETLDVQEAIQLLMIGGGYIITQVRNRTVTDDVDIVWVRPEIYSGSEVYRLFEVAIKVVARHEGLDSAWLSKAQKVLDKYINRGLQQNGDVDEILDFYFPR